ncbi:MAG: mechanosensitive ion channel family protein [Clostridia bacterium]|nr:mechanosensitive ion channel family protein [Clostridia bacterium]
MLSDFSKKINEIWQELPGLFTRLIAALGVLLLGIIVIKLGRRLIKKSFQLYRSKHPTAGRGDTVQTLLMSVFNVAMYVAISLTCLSTLGVDVKSLLTVAGVGGVAIAFGCQTLVKDIVSGMFLWIEGTCNVGDVVTVAGQTGRIESVALRTTTLRATNGAVYVIPNGEIRTVVNMTSDYRCAVVDITVAHGSDYEKALGVLHEAMVKVRDELDFLDEVPVIDGFISMDRGAATCRIECRCSVDKCWELERIIRLRALEALAEANIKP